MFDPLIVANEALGEDALSVNDQPPIGLLSMMRALL